MGLCQSLRERQPCLCQETVNSFIKGLDFSILRVGKLVALIKKANNRRCFYSRKRT